MRQKYVDLIKDFINKKPEYKEILDEIKEDTQIVGATEEEFEEAIKEVETFQQEPSSKKEKIKRIALSHPKALRLSAVAALLVIMTPFLAIGYSKFSGGNNIVPLAKENLNSNKPKADDGIIRVVYANSTPIDMDNVFSVSPDKVVLAVTGKPSKEILGFFPYWMMDNWDKVNLGSLTSVALFGLEANGNGEIITRRDDGVIDPGWEMWQNPNLPTLINKARNKHIKIFLTIKNFNNDNIEKLANSDEAQQQFVANVSYLVNSRNLDGVNLDFEPTRGMNQKTRDGFTRLVKNLGNELRKQNPSAKITIDTYLVSGSEQGLFDLSKLASEIDSFVIMGYDMHTLRGDPGPLAAMGGNANVIGYVQNYLEKVPPSKIILAVPYYGYDWPQTKDKAEGKAVPYAVISENLKNSKLSWDENSQTPFYAYSENGVSRVVHFDNIRSLGIKYDFINNKDLKGVGIWALGYDGTNTDLQKLLNDKFYIPN